MVPKSREYFRHFAWFGLCLLLNGSVLAQEEVQLWPEGNIPFARDHDVQEYEAECWFTACAYRVSIPTLTVYPALGEASGDAVLVIPGGGYDVVAIHHEGHHIAQAYAERGIHAAVLKYRLPHPETSNEPWKVPIADARRALRLLRERQAEFGMTVERLGMVGFSAGAHLATVASVHPSPDALENPDFSMLIYGVTRLTDENLEWLQNSLYHRELSDEEIAYETLLDHVTPDTPPAFLVHAYDDDTCHYSESTLYAEQLTAHGVEAELHLYAKGGHGFSLGRAEDGTDQWVDLSVAWLAR